MRRDHMGNDIGINVLTAYQAASVLLDKSRVKQNGLPIPQGRGLRPFVHVNCSLDS